MLGKNLSSCSPAIRGNNVLSSAVSAQVLFCYEQFDELTLLHLREFDKKKLISVETDIVVDHYKEENFEESRPGIMRFPWPFLLHAVLLPWVCLFQHSCSS